MGKSKKAHFQHFMNLNVRGLELSATLAINEKSNKLRSEGKNIYKLGLGQSPFPVPESVVEALRQNAHQKDYLPVKGLPKLREAITEFNLITEKVQFEPENIMIGPGSKELIFLLQLVYYGDLIIPTPSWVSYSPQAKIIGRNVHWVQTKKENQWRLTPEKLEEICESDPERPRIVILNYPSNPTGYTYPLERLKQLAQVARKYRVILVSDEIYGMLHHNNKHVSIARFYPEGTIISSGLSKWCGAGGWRLGTFSFPEELSWLQNALAVVASETFTSTSAPIQYAAIRAFQMGDDIDLYLHHSRRILKTIAKNITHTLNNIYVDVQLPHGGFYIFPDFGYYKDKLAKKGVTSSYELCNKILSETGVAMLPGSDFGRDQSELTCRIAYVDFDGKRALEYADKHPDLGIGFMDEVSPNIKHAIEKLGNWLCDL
ncbi:MAG: pyridoxal phosphate-dependent aminotransferase [Bacteroidetes bacterium]|nr:pyridoxal phosphate-dependent aminotransferase [Bacteroidota bacterium]MBT4970150.1 pyridoxal phosphate-dependent aminotransferase [Bacteroidota bacterium]MBT7041868.1 pyridoxal phosphate-dependent aminotransferase [Bacteroidota bacterium]